MSTPPFIAIPDGVALFEPPGTPVPVLVAEPVTRVTGVTADADVAAERESGTILLVPGFTGSKEDFIAVLMPLAALGWRVAAMDLPGQGGAPSLGPRGSHTAAALGAVVAQVAAAASPDAPVHLVGHSMGGLVTREVVLTEPSLVATWVPLCSGPATIGADQIPGLTQLQLAVSALPLDQVWVHKEALDRAGGWSPPSPDVADFVARRFVSNDPAALLDFADLLLTAPDRTEEVAAVMSAHGIGGAVLTGQTDDAWPLADQERMAQRLGVPWVVLPGVGHNPAAEDPEVTAHALDAVLTGARQPHRRAVGNRTGQTGPAM